MTTLREAAQQAVEEWRTDPGSVRMASLMMMLESALAEPVQEPNYWQEEARRYAGNADYWRDRAKRAEPVEPVAWMAYTEDGKSVCVTDNPADFTEHHRALPLYTAPPQRKPLTVEQIKECERKSMVNGALPFEQREFFARAIEQAHGIGSKT